MTIKQHSPSDLTHTPTYLSVSVREASSRFLVDTELFRASRPTASWVHNAELYSPESDADIEYLRGCLYNVRDVCNFVTDITTYEVCEWRQGFSCARSGSLGPCGYAPVMLVNDVSFRSDEIASVIEYCESVGYSDVAHWYVTGLCKYRGSGDKIKAADVKNCRVVFEQELKLCAPKYVLFFGISAMKFALPKIPGLPGKQASAVGGVYPVTYAFADGSTLNFKVIVFPKWPICKDATTPGGASYAEIQWSVFRRDLEGVGNVIPVRHTIITDPTYLDEEVDRIINLAKTDSTRRLIAVDLEWEGAYPQQPGARVLTIQFSSHAGEASVIVLDSFDTVIKQKRLTAALNRLLTHHDDWAPRLGGHFLRADLPWLISLGVAGTEPGKDLLYSYKPSEMYESCGLEGGWDTSLMYHAYTEKDVYGLKEIAQKELDLPAWNRELTAALQKHKEATREPITGYGCVPMGVLIPYAAWDVDATRRLLDLCMFGEFDTEGNSLRPALLNDDGFGNSSWEPYWRAHRASLGFFDIESTGLLLDVDRYVELSDTVYASYRILLQVLREQICWPDFNPNSNQQVSSVLFGEPFTTVPPGVKSLQLQPVYNTDKVMLEEWTEDITSFIPSADKDVMSILVARDERARLLWSVRVLGHTLSSVLSIPEERWDAQGYHKLLHGGLFSKRREGGCVHTSMSQLKATGRSSSSQPPLQNISKSAEDKFQNILGYYEGEEPKGFHLDLLGSPQYRYPLRTVLRAPKDYVLIESDFMGAELAVLAWASGDENMIDHVRRNTLSEDDPDYYDIHSNIAVSAFRLDCAPTKHGLASIHKKHLRVAAKSIAFGIPYGRGVRSLAMECRVKGIQVNLAETQGLVDTYYKTYPRVKEFLTQSKAAVHTCGFVRTLFNRFRRFKLLADTPDNVVAKMEREFSNAVIQGTVADAVNVAMANLTDIRFRNQLDFRIVCQIHDALLVQVHKSQAKFMWNVVLPDAMVAYNPIVLGDQVYRFGIDSEMYVHWGEPITEGIAQKELGMSISELQ